MNLFEKICELTKNLTIDEKKSLLRKLINEYDNDLRNIMREFIRMKKYEKIEKEQIMQYKCYNYNFYGKQKVKLDIIESESESESESEKE